MQRLMFLCSGFPSLVLKHGIALTVTSSLLLVGCRETAPVAQDAGAVQSGSSVVNSDSVPATHVIMSPTTTVLPDNAASEVSPATIDDSDPKAVCQRFLESLQSGNRIAAENLLTHKALQVTGKADLVLEPLSGPNSRFDVRDPQFATIKNEIAYVDCQITDHDETGDHSFTVSWIVKKQNENWRISGLLMPLEEGSPNKMFSFENPNDVDEIKRRAAEDLAQESSPSESARHADLKATQSTETIK